MRCHSCGHPIPMPACGLPSRRICGACEAMLVNTPKMVRWRLFYEGSTWAREIDDLYALHSPESERYVSRLIAAWVID